jgi:hypothetical protein
MSFNLKIEGNFISITDTVSGGELFRSSVENTTFIVDASDVFKFERNFTGAQSFNFDDILDDRTGLAFTSVDALKTFLSTKLGLPTPTGGGGASAWGDITGTLSDQTDLQAELDGKVDENSAITGATKTKVTYDSKGLVTSGTDATTADIADSTNKRYVTDAQQTVITNTSGTNTGDQDLSVLVAKSAYTPAHSILVQQSGTGSPTSLAVGNDTILGRVTGGDIDDLSATQVRTILNVANGATANSSDAYLLDRANHTGTQLASTISDFDTEVSNNVDVTANTAKVTNANHTGEVTGSTSLTVDKTAITNKATVTPASGDFVLISNTSDSGNLKKVDASNFLGGGGGGYTLSVQALTSTPADGATIYFGQLPKAPTTTANISKVFIPKTGTITRAVIYCYSGTAGTAENWSCNIRLNNTTDTLVETIGASANERIFNNEALSISVTAGDYIEIKMVNPTWATNPATTIFGGYLFIE